MTSRQAVRVLLLDDADRLLLVRFWDGDRSWWCTPGGGIEPGETDEAAALREIHEELGTEAVDLGPHIWTRRHIGVIHGRTFDQSERIYLGRVASFEPRPSPEALREHGTDDIRWWTARRVGGGNDRVRAATSARIGPRGHSIRSACRTDRCRRLNHRSEQSDHDRQDAATGILCAANGPLAQRLEQGTFNPRVVGSNPTRPSTMNLQAPPDMRRAARRTGRLCQTRNAKRVSCRGSASAAAGRPRGALGTSACHRPAAACTSDRRCRRTG